VFKPLSEQPEDLQQTCIVACGTLQLMCGTLRYAFFKPDLAASRQKVPYYLILIARVSGRCDRLETRFWARDLCLDRA
jgi:hypothetical protein